MGSPPIAFGKIKLGLFIDDQPGLVRFSSALRALRHKGLNDSADQLAADQAVAGANCPTHGKLADPIIGLYENRVAFACPWCSGSDVLAAWEAEGQKPS